MTLQKNMNNSAITFWSLQKNGSIMNLTDSATFSPALIKCVKLRLNQIIINLLEKEVTNLYN